MFVSKREIVFVIFLSILSHKQLLAQSPLEMWNIFGNIEKPSSSWKLKKFSQKPLKMKAIHFSRKHMRI